MNSQWRDTSAKYNTAVFIGRFQPFHLGHKAVIERALQIAERIVVLVGSAGTARRPRNPWTYEERVGMIEEEFPRRVICKPLPDFTYRDDRWMEAVQNSVAGHGSVVLVGQSKDESGYYLKKFPQWGSEAAEGPPLNATDIRETLFGEGPISGIPTSTEMFLEVYRRTPEFRRMCAEWAFIKQYRATHDSGEYSRNNVTADAVVLQSAHVLMVRRGAMPGMGMLALPGGHVGRKEHPTDAALRELREETRIKVPDAVLRGSIVDKKWFDDPYRSDLARTYTKAVFIRLNEPSLPKVKGGDDAKSALWVPLANLREDECFDDHYQIIQWFVG